MCRLRDQCESGTEALANIESQYIRSKAEKKQLKTYALQLKADAELWGHEKSEFSSRILALEVALAKSKEENLSKVTDASLQPPEELKSFSTGFNTPTDRVASISAIPYIHCPSSSSSAYWDYDADKFLANPDLVLLSSPSWRELLVKAGGELEMDQAKRSESLPRGEKNKRNSVSMKKTSAAQKLLQVHSPLGF